MSRATEAKAKDRQPGRPSGWTPRSSSTTALDLIQVTTNGWKATSCAEGDTAILIFFRRFPRRTIVAATIPRLLLFALSVSTSRAHPPIFSIGADVVIPVDAAVVMVENIFRQLALLHDRPSTPCCDQGSGGEGTGHGPCRGRDRGELLRRSMSSPPSELVQSMADTMVPAPAGSPIVTLTLLLVLVWLMRRGCTRAAQHGVLEYNGGNGERGRRPPILGATIGSGAFRRCR